MTGGPCARGAAALVGAALAALAAAGCGETIKETYVVQITGPSDEDYFAGAKEIVFEVGGREVDRKPVSPGRAIDLSASGIDPTVTASTVFGVRALDGAGGLVAFGQSPEIELALAQSHIWLFMQRPGTFGRSRDISFPRKGHVGVAVSAPPVAGVVGARPVTIAFFGMGRAIVPVQPNPAEPARAEEIFSDSYYAYDPIAHSDQDLLSGPAAGGIAQPRTEASALVRADGTVLVFGGLARPASAEAPRSTAQLDVFRVRRDGFASFRKEVAATRNTDDRRIPRFGAPLAAANLVYAPGGRNDEGPLDTVVAIDPAAEVALTVIEPRLATPRAGHTATAVSAEVGVEVLIVGGGAADKPVAEILVPGPPPRLLVPEGDAGPPRRDHAAVPLPSPDGRVLIVGGLGPDGAPLASSVIYLPRRRAFERSPLTLETPRSGFVAFVVRDDLVIAGGRDAAGKPIGGAEVFDATSLQPVGKPRAHARARATAQLLGNESVVVLGGEDDRTSSAVVEIYQPRR